MQALATGFLVVVVLLLAVTGIAGCAPERERTQTTPTRVAGAARVAPATREAGGAGSARSGTEPVAVTVQSDTSLAETVTLTVASSPAAPETAAGTDPTATPDPAGLARAHGLAALGRREAAREAYRDLVAGGGDTGRQAAGVLADMALDDGDDLGAIAVLEAVSDGGDLASLPPPALYHYGVALENTGRTDEAVAAYARYGEAVPAMVDIAWLAAGNALFAAGRHREALGAFTRARDEAGDDVTRYQAALRRGNALLRTGPVEETLAAYREAHDRATDDEQRAQALAGAIAAHLQVDRTEDALDVRRQLVRELPGTALAPAALARLAESGESVPTHEEAAVHAGSGDHAAAVVLYETSIAESAGAPIDWYLALAGSYRALAQRDAELAVLERALTSHPSDPRAPEAAWHRALALAALGREREAAQAFADLSERWPGDTRAPEALWRRALILEGLDGWLAGAEGFDALAQRHRDADLAADARFRAALLHMRAGRLAEAWERFALEAGGEGDGGAARALYWLGRIAADTGDPSEAADHWARAADADPDGYYGVRAADRLGSPPAGPDTDADVAAWLSSWASGAVGSSWPEARATVAARREVARAVAWLDLGERGAALRSLRAAHRSMVGEPELVAALAFEAAGMGLHDVAISAASRVLATAPAAARAAAPLALRRLAYPDAYGDLVRAQAAAHGVPPALMFALVRQESRFEPTALSPAGARGLTQVMPGTGQTIAGWLGEPGFEVETLFQPETALRYGAWFIGQQLEQFEARVPAALSAYNGGPGNARRWLDEAEGDLDVMAEIIDYRETRRYVRLVTEARAQYERLYPDLR